MQSADWALSRAWQCVFDSISTIWWSPVVGSCCQVITFSNRQFFMPWMQEAYRKRSNFRGRKISWVKFGGDKFSWVRVDRRNCCHYNCSSLQILVGLIFVRVPCQQPSCV